VLAQSQTPKPPCSSTKVASGQLSVGADAAFFNAGQSWSAGPGANTAGQVFWDGTAATTSSGYGAKLTAGLNFSFSFSTSVLPSGMQPNSGTGSYFEAQGDFLLGGGFTVSTSADGTSITIGLRPSVGFAAYAGSGTTTDSTIASNPLTCTP
jgi:hypothetical protein